MEQWQKPETLAIWLTVIILFVLILVTFILRLMHVNFKRILIVQERESDLQISHKQELLNATIRAQENERERIARDLHDELINKLYVYRLTQNEKKDLQPIDDCILIARRISHDLSPPILDGSSIEELIFNLMQPWREKFEVNFHVLNPIPNDLINEDKVQVLRILQESITNVEKHAKASKIELKLRAFRTGIALAFEDNGVGFDLNNFDKGLGITNLESRVALLKGAFRIRSKPGETTRILVFIPKES